MAEEAEFYRDHFHAETKEMFGSTEFEHFSVNGNDVYLGLSGIGKVNAAMNLTSLLTKEKIDVIFMTGSAGSLQDDVHRKDVILVNDFAYHDAHCVSAGEYVEGQIPREPATFKLNSPEREAFKKYLGEEDVDFKEGLVVTGDTFVDSAEKIAKIKKEFPEALACEMEGAAIGQAASQFNIPFLVVRAMSDTADGEATQSFDEFIDEAGKKSAEMVIHFVENLV